MLTRIRRLFTIKTKFEAYLVIYGLGLGAVERGVHYLQTYPGIGGWRILGSLPRRSPRGMAGRRCPGSKGAFS